MLHVASSLHKTSTEYITKTTRWSLASAAARWHRDVYDLTQHAAISDGNLLLVDAGGDYSKEKHSFLPHINFKSRPFHLHSNPLLALAPSRPEDMSVKAVAAAPAVERIGSYRLKKTLGIGSFGRVCLYMEFSAARDHGALPSFREASALDAHPSTLHSRTH